MKKLIPIIFSFVMCLIISLPVSVAAEGEDNGYDFGSMHNDVIDNYNHISERADQTDQKIDDLDKKVSEMDPEKAIKDYFDQIKEDDVEEPTAEKTETIDDKYKLPTGSTSKKVLAGPRAMANMADYFLEAAINMIMWADPSSSVYIDKGTNSEFSKQIGSYSINLSDIEKPSQPLGKLVDPIRIFAYSLVLLFFAVNLVEQTIKYEIFTVKGILQIFGRLILAKIIIDLSVRICMLIIAIIGSITVKMLDTVNVTLNIFPDITLKKSDVKIIGPILDAIVAFVVSAILMIIIGVVLVCVSIVMIKLVLRSIELAMLMVISPAFFACLSSDVTKEYFKKFISIFIQVAAQTLFMAIAVAVCSGHFNTPAVPIDSLSGLAVGLIRLSPNILIAIAMCVMMIKPPKVLTNLVK